MRIITWLVFFTLVISFSKAFADCPNSLIETKSRNATHYEWTGTCFSWGKCEPCGPKYKRELVSKMRYFGSCTRREIANQRVDGCSAPTLTPYSKKFKHACDEHDICYSSPGSDQKKCDKSFLENLKSMCRFDNQAPCRAMAQKFYLAVKMFGKKSHENGQVFAEKNCR